MKSSFVNEIFKSPSVRLLSLTGIFLIMMFITGMSQAFITQLHIGERNIILLGSAVQALLLFITTAWLTAKLISPQPWRYLGTLRAPSWKSILGIFIITGAGIPLINQIVFWNESINFPSTLETTLRALENQATATTDILLADKSLWGLLSGVLVAGVLTGFAEELFFRGTLQNILREMMPAQGAIWTAAAVFSFLHLQFYGFVPRMLIGAFFGFIYLRTSSVWAAAIAHALNNSIVVVTYWLIANGFTNDTALNTGVAETGFPLIPALSAIIVTLLLVLLSDFFFKKVRRC